MSEKYALKNRAGKKITIQNLGLKRKKLVKKKWLGGGK